MTISGPAVQTTAQPQRQFAAFSLSNRFAAAMAGRDLYYGWVVVGEKFPVDMDFLKDFVHSLADFRVSDFVKDVVTSADLQDYGFVTNTVRLTLRAHAGDSADRNGMRPAQLHRRFGGAGRGIHGIADDSRARIS